MVGEKPITLFIKNMVSLRCKMIVAAELEKLAVRHLVVELGEVVVLEKLSAQIEQALKASLHYYGLELMDNRKAILVEKVKNVVVQMIHHDDELPTTKYSVYISQRLNLDYTYLSNLFSEVKGISIECFIIAHKVERVKELLIYDELTLTQIARKLHYSSVSHLSSQFKKTTGLTPSFFKQMKNKRLIAHEDL